MPPCAWCGHDWEAHQHHHVRTYCSSRLDDSADGVCPCDVYRPPKHRRWTAAVRRLADRLGGDTHP